MANSLGKASHARIKVSHSRPGENWLDLAVVAFLTNSAAGVGVITPTVVGMFTAGARFSLPDATLLGSAELAGLTVPLLAGPLLVLRVRPRMTAFAAIVVAVLAQLASLMDGPALLIAAYRLMAGVGEGFVYALAVARLAATAAPDRAFGVMVTSNHLFGAILLTAISWLSVSHPGSAVIWMMVVLLVLTAVAAARLPDTPTASRAAAAASTERDRPAPRTSAFLGMFGVFLLATAFGFVWPLMGTFGHLAAIPPKSIAMIFFLAGASGFLPGLLVATIGVRFGRTTSLVAGTLVFAGALALPGTRAPFPLSPPLIMMMWTFCLPFYLGLVAILDGSGRLAVFTTAMIPLGIACGQAVAGQLTRIFGLNGIPLGGSLIAMLALAVSLVAIQRFCQRTQQIKRTTESGH